MKVLVITPAYNEEKNICAVCDQVRRISRTIDLKDVSIEHLVINDASKDNTAGLLQHGQFSYLDLPINLGIGGAVQSGYLYAKENQMDIVIQLDGDGQHNAEELPKLIKPILDGQAEIVIGSRFIDKTGFQSTGLRRVGIRFLSGLLRLLTGTRIKDVTSGFRAVNKRFIDSFAADYPGDYPEPVALVKALKGKARIQEVPVVMMRREHGESSIKGLLSIYYMCKVSIEMILEAFF